MSRTTDTQPREPRQAEPWARLIGDLEAAGVSTCVLAPGGAAGGDELLLLVARRSIGAARGALSTRGLREVGPAGAAGGPWSASERYVAYDEEGARLLSVGLATDLRARTPSGGELELPWSAEALATRRPDGEHGVHRLAPPLALLAELCLSASGVVDPEGAARSLEGVRESEAQSELAALAQRLLGAPAGDAVARLFAAPVDAAAVGRFARDLRGRLGAFERARAQAPSARGLRGRGAIVAFLGCDGSGKSTATGEVERWLSSCVDVRRVYMGSGDGPSSWWRWPMKLVHQRMSGPGGAAAEAASGEKRGRSLKRTLRRAARPVWAVALSLEKRARLREAWDARDRGEVVICDRFPQNEIMGFNDGPLLAAWADHGSRVLRWLARWEAEPYAWAAAAPPDLVVKMQVSEAVAAERRPEMVLEGIRRKIDAVGRLELGGAPLALIDADRPLEEVLSRVRRAVWDAL